MKKTIAIMEKLSERHSSLQLIGRLLIFLCVFMLLCGAAWAEDGLIGLWRYQYNDNINLFNLMADNSYQMVISTNDQQGATLTGKYRASGNAITMTENVDGNRKRIGDFTYVYKVYGDIAVFDDENYIRVAKEDAANLLANPYADYNRTTITEREAIELLFDSIYDRNDIVNISLNFDGEHYRYEYYFQSPDGEISNPWGIGFQQLSTGDEFGREFYIFRLYESVYFDGEFSHSATGDFYAVNRNNGDIIAERGGKDPDEWNAEFPW